MREVIATDDELIVVETTIKRKRKRIAWESIGTEVVPDYDNGESPWDSCDGLEHEIDWLRSCPDEYGDAENVGYSDSNRQYFRITIDDSTVRAKWGIPAKYQGASRQVVAEYIARAKARTIAQLVRWYSHGWEWYGAKASYGDCETSVWGIDSADYAQELADDELRWEVARELEQAGHTVTGKPEPRSYSRVDSMRDRIKRQLCLA